MLSEQVCTDQAILHALDDSDFECDPGDDELLSDENIIARAELFQRSLDVEHGLPANEEAVRVPVEEANNVPVEAENAQVGVENAPVEAENISTHRRWKQKSFR